mmetsp:Transcript_26711/g.70536  ORF Transcript_26711/g.70536 Transcript_26711/m.70536 type:complete len:442 (-) Transcript_26711:262-1587(-)
MRAPPAPPQQRLGAQHPAVCLALRGRRGAVLPAAVARRALREDLKQVALHDRGELAQRQVVLLVAEGPLAGDGGHLHSQQRERDREDHDHAQPGVRRRQGYRQAHQVEHQHGPEVRDVGEGQRGVVDPLHGAEGPGEGADLVLHLLELHRRDGAVVQLVAPGGLQGGPAHPVAAEQRLHGRLRHLPRLGLQEHALELQQGIGSLQAQVIPRRHGEGHHPAADVVARGGVVRAEGDGLAGQDPADLNELACSRARVVEAHRRAVQAVDQEEGERHDQEGVALHEKSFAAIDAGAGDVPPLPEEVRLRGQGAQHGHRHHRQHRGHHVLHRPPVQPQGRAEPAAEVAAVRRRLVGHHAGAPGAAAAAARGAAPGGLLGLKGPPWRRPPRRRRAASPARGSEAGCPPRPRRTGSAAGGSPGRGRAARRRRRPPPLPAARTRSRRS